MALKTVEANALIVIADIRYGLRERNIEVKFERQIAFCPQHIWLRLEGLWKQDLEVKSKLKSRPLKLVSISVPVLIMYRYISSTIDSLSTTCSEPICHQDSWLIFSHPWLPGN